MGMILNPETGELTFVIAMDTLNFSYNVVPVNTTITIPQYQQMIVVDDLELEGDINIEGSLALI